MSQKKAYIVTFTVTTRILAVPDSYGDIPDEDIDRARIKAVEMLDSGGHSEYLKDYEEDMECPYDSLDDDNSDL